MRWALDAATAIRTNPSTHRVDANGATLVSNVLARTLCEAAEARGVRVQQLRAAALSGSLGPGDAAFLDLDQFARLLEAAVSQTGDPAFGLHWGERALFTNFGIVAAVAQWAPSPRRALMALTHFQGLLFQGRPIASFEVRGRTAVLRYETDWFPRAARRAWAEFVVVGTFELLKQLCGRQTTSATLFFPHSAPAYEHEYRRILGNSIAFDRDCCMVEFETASLDRALPQFNERLNEAVTFEANCELARIEGTQRCSERVHEQLLTACPTVPAMDDVARKLGMSGRTLRRRLKQEGTAFPTLVAEALRDRALQMLGDPKASVKEIAYRLGFATPNAFHRAFKRWTGSSPSVVRASRSHAARETVDRAFPQTQL